MPPLLLKDFVMFKIIPILFLLSTQAFGQYSVTVPNNYDTPLGADTLLVRDVNSEFEFATGRRGGVDIVNVAGQNEDIDIATTPEDVWDGGGTYTGQPSGAAETVTCVSSSANDAAAGSGARTLKLTGLSDTFEELEETITLNGVTGVATTNTFSRVFQGDVLSSGSSNTAFNAGTITCNHTTTTANVFFVMKAGVNRARVGAYTIPAGKTGYLRNIFFELARQTTASITASIYIKENGISPRLFRPFTDSNESPYNDRVFGGIELPARTDIRVRVESSDADNISVTTTYDIILVDN